MAAKDINIAITASDKTKAAFASVQRSMAGVNSTAQELGRTLGMALPAVGLVGLTAMVKGTIDAGDALNDMSKRAGVAVEDLASLKLAADQNGTSLEDVGKAIAKLSLSFSQAQGGNDQVAESLKRLGVNSGDAKERLFQLADAYAKAGGDSRILSDLQKVLGKSYAEIIPLLSEGGDALRKSALASASFGEAMRILAPEADKFNDTLAEVKINAAAAAAQFAGPFVKAINDIGVAFRTAGNETDAFGEIGKAAGNAMKGLAISGFGVSQAFKEVGLSIGAAGAAAVAVAKGEFTRAVTIMKLLFSDLDKENQNFKARIDALVIGTAAAGGTARTRRAGAIDFPSAPSKGKPDKLDVIDPFYAQRTAALKAAAKETQDFIDDQQKSINELNSELAQDKIKAIEDYQNALASLISDTDIEKTRKLQESVAILDRAMFEGTITTEQWAQAFEKLNGGKEKLQELDSFAKTAAKNIQNSFADFLFDPFDKGMSGMLKSFGQTIQRMIADAVAADLTKYLFGDLIKGGSGSGIAGGLLTSFFGLFGGGKADGGPLSPGKWYIAGEHGPEPIWGGGSGAYAAGYGGGVGHTVIVNNYGMNSVPDLSRATAQAARQGLSAFERAKRYG